MLLNYILSDKDGKLYVMCLLPQLKVKTQNEFLSFLETWKIWQHDLSSQMAPVGWSSKVALSLRLRCAAIPTAAWFWHWGKDICYHCLITILLQSSYVSCLNPLGHLWFRILSVKMSHIPDLVLTVCWHAIQGAMCGFLPTILHWGRADQFDWTGLG